MIPETIVALLIAGFIAGCIVCWPMAQRRGELKAMRRAGMIDDDDSDQWWDL